MVSIVVFIMGRTGSGKSTTARFLAEIAQDLGWSIKTLNDYPILREMYETDTGSRYRFRPADHNGFEVLDLSVYGLAIQKLARQLRSYHPENDQTLITVEFTSNNYLDALRLFDETLLRGAHFVFLNADLPTCMERISRRIFHRTTADDYHVIENVLLRHYPSPYMPLRIGKEKAKFIPNMASIDELKNEVQSLAPALLERSKYKPEPNPVLEFAKWFSGIRSAFVLLNPPLLSRKKTIVPLKPTRVYAENNEELSDVKVAREPTSSARS